ncbi:MAG: hypothetical protein PHT58_07050 [Eubacteriales bacterium]|nr:hypothetical protein [Eubacteriales bacterium]
MQKLIDSAGATVVQYAYDVWNIQLSEGNSRSTNRFYGKMCSMMLNYDYMIMMLK